MAKKKNKNPGKCPVCGTTQNNTPSYRTELTLESVPKHILNKAKDELFKKFMIDPDYGIPHIKYIQNHHKVHIIHKRISLI